MCCGIVCCRLHGWLVKTDDLTSRRAASFPRAFSRNPEFPLDNSLIVNMDARHAQRASAALRRARRQHSGMTKARHCLLQIARLAGENG